MLGGPAYAKTPNSLFVTSVRIPDERLQASSVYPTANKKTPEKLSN